MIARDMIRRASELSRATKDLYGKIAVLVRQVAPQLLAEPGIGVLLAARFIGEIAGINRFTSDAQLARLAGCAPIPVSSGRSDRRNETPIGLRWSIRSDGRRQRRREREREMRNPDEGKGRWFSGGRQRNWVRHPHPDVGSGVATHLGRYTLDAGEDVDLASGAITNGFFTLTSAHGDTVTGAYSGNPLPGLTGYVVSGPITGGTGRFSGATGTLVWNGKLDPVALSFTDDIVGTIYIGQLLN